MRYKHKEKIQHDWTKNDIVTLEWPKIVGGPVVLGGVDKNVYNPDWTLIRYKEDLVDKEADTIQLS